jgi:hypothetical protein
VANSFLKRPIGNTLGFASYMISITTTQLSPCCSKEEQLAMQSFYDVCFSQTDLFLYVLSRTAFEQQGLS